MQAVHLCLYERESIVKLLSMIKAQWMVSIRLTEEGRLIQFQHTWACSRHICNIFEAQGMLVASFFGATWGHV